jgi:hypothetical protein
MKRASQIKREMIENARTNGVPAQSQLDAVWARVSERVVPIFDSASGGSMHESSDGAMNAMGHQIAAGGSAQISSLALTSSLLATGGAIATLGAVAMVIWLAQAFPPMPDRVQSMTSPSPAALKSLPRTDAAPLPPHELERTAIPAKSGLPHSKLGDDQASTTATKRGSREKQPAPRRRSKRRTGTRHSQNNRAHAVRESSLHIDEQVGMVAPLRSTTIEPQAKHSTSLAQEVLLIDRARLAIDRAQREKAQSWLDLHERRFPAGTLRPERESLRSQLRAHLQKGEN